MSAPGAWVGRCIVQQVVALSPEAAEAPVVELVCHAAAWTDSLAGFTDGIARELERQGYTLISVDEAQPIIEWMVLHGYHEVVEPLSVRVSADHPIALGPVAPAGSDAAPHVSALNGCEPWVGRCFFREWLEAPDPDRPHLTPRYKDYACHAAVWTDRQDGFLAAIKRHLEAQGYAFTWAEDILPAVQWLSRHGYHDEVMTLSPQVAPECAVVMGSVTRTDEQGHPIQETWLVIDEISDVEPLDAQFGIYPLKSVPDTLRGPLFDQPEPAVMDIAARAGDHAAEALLMKTFALLDAAKVRWLPERLEASGLLFRCLFTGTAEEELKAVAPYLVELAEEGEFTRQLFTHSGFPSDLWESNSGIFIRSCGSFDVVWKHCRKFTRVRDAQGKWFYFRFWESRYATAYFHAIVHDRDRAQHWFLCDGATPLSILTVNTEQQGAWLFSPQKELSFKQPGTPFLYGELEQGVFSQVRKDDFSWKLKQYLEDESLDFADKDEVKRLELSAALIDEAQRYGIEIERGVADFAMASLILARPLTDEPILERILASEMNALNKGKLLLREARAIVSAERPDRSGDD